VLQFDRRVYVSGQIGLNPAAMTLVDGGPVMESRLSLRHVGRVVAVMSSSACLCCSVLVICYTTSHDAAVSAQTEFNNALSSAHTSEARTSSFLFASVKSNWLKWHGHILKKDLVKRCMVYELVGARHRGSFINNDLKTRTSTSRTRTTT